MDEKVDFMEDGTKVEGGVDIIVDSSEDRKGVDVILEEECIDIRFSSDVFFSCRSKI